MEKSNLVDMNALKEELKKKGYKLTPQRRSIVDTIIENEGQHLTAEEIYDKVKKDCPEIGLATVYRTILVLEELGVISESAKGWQKELNLVSWNEAEPKYDLRDWAPDHEKMGKGITLSADEVQELFKLLEDIVKK